MTASCRREASTFFILFLPFNPQQLNDFVAQQLNDFLAGKHRLHRERSGSLGLLAVDAQSRSPACRADAGGGGLWSGALNAEGPETAPSLRRKMEWKLLLSGWLGTERVEGWLGTERASCSDAIAAAGGRIIIIVTQAANLPRSAPSHLLSARQA